LLLFRIYTGKTKEIEKIFTKNEKDDIIKKYSKLLDKIRFLEAPGKRILKNLKKTLKKVLTKASGFDIIVKRSREAAKTKRNSRAKRTLKIKQRENLWTRNSRENS